MQTIKCMECPYFEIEMEPLRSANGICWDTGQAVCKKYDLVVDFYNHGKLKRLTCIEEGNG